MTRVLSRLSRTDTAPSSPPAARPQRAWWRDMRVAAGIGLIIFCMLVGARMLSGGADTVTAWQATRDLAVGAVVAAWGLVEQGHPCVHGAEEVFLLPRLEDVAVEGSGVEASVLHAEGAAVGAGTGAGR